MQKLNREEGNTSCLDHYMSCLVVGGGFRRFSDPGKERTTERRPSDSSLSDPNIWKRDFDPEAIWGQKSGSSSLCMIVHVPVFFSSQF